MARFTKAIGVEAVRYTGDNVPEVSSFIRHHHKKEIEWYTSAPPMPILPGPTQRHTAYIGMWIIAVDDGKFVTMSADSFECLFET